MLARLALPALTIAETRRLSAPATDHVIVVLRDQHPAVAAQAASTSASRAAILQELRQVGVADVLVIDDNSPDGTGRITKMLHHRHPERVHSLHRLRNEGLGCAYAAGYDLASAPGVRHRVADGRRFFPPPRRPTPAG